MPDLGFKLGAQVQIDTALTVAAGGSVAGSAFDLGDPASVVQAAALSALFALTQTGTTDTPDLTVRLEWSDDNFSSDVPDAGEAPVVFTWVGAAAGADLGRSGRVAFTPQARYGRFRFDNANGTDAFDVESWVAEHLLTDGA